MQKGKNMSEKTKYSIKKTIRFFLSIIIFLTIGFIIINYVPFISKYDNYVIITNSMEPIINVNDLAIVDSSVPAEDIEVGQIIAFNVDLNEDGTDEVVVHYLYSVTETDDGTIYKTISEIGNQKDPWQLSADDILGVHVLTIPKIGNFLLFTQSTIGRIILIFDVVIIYIILELLVDEKDKKKNKNKEQVEESE